MRAEDVQTFEEFRLRVGAGVKVAPLAPADVVRLRTAATQAHERYRSTAGGPGGPQRDADPVVDAVRHLAEVRSGAGSHMPFAVALEQILVELARVAA